MDSAGNLGHCCSDPLVCPRAPQDVRPLPEDPPPDRFPEIRPPPQPAGASELTVAQLLLSSFDVPAGRESYRQKPGSLRLRSKDRGFSQRGHRPQEGC